MDCFIQSFELHVFLRFDVHPKVEQAACLLIRSDLTWTVERSLDEDIFLCLGIEW